ncbi:phosphatase PAP2 family protein [Sediminibacillus massiliensis]|uniref:phosphatase PAP2 family protein n=1 Tax=Sediminibacillus massiliensis TaxID=1926277 RepID=UPI001FE44959|nr:phosphatase PAP2 family protein [Sediminibacillus massiliensis]
MMVFEAIHDMAGKSGFLDQTMILLSSWGFVLFLVLMVVMPLVPRIRKIALFNLGGLAVALLLNRILKILIDRPRPFMENEVDILVPKQPSPSFPSDQALIAGVFAGAVWFLNLKRWMRITAVAIAILVVISRVFVGHHYPADVAAGFLLGAGISMVINTLIPHRKQAGQKEMKRIPS